VSDAVEHEAGEHGHRLEHLHEGGQREALVQGHPEARFSEEFSPELFRLKFISQYF
jgi:hypothetical protein